MREYLINADFDLSLRPDRAPDRPDDARRQAAEIAWHLLLLGCDGDSVLVDAAPDEDFLAYLENAGLKRPATVVLPEVTRNARLRPFGWNALAERHDRSYARPSPHPPLEVVRRVNGRRFAAEVERELFGVDEVLGVFETADDVAACIASRPRGEEWVVKSEHGNAGLGNRRLRSPVLDETDRGVVRRLLDEDRSVLLERWRRRVLDFSSVFEIERDGSVGEAHVHEVVNTADGAFLGAVFDRDASALEPWRERVTDIASRVGRRLVEEGYFGPVCLDHFVWKDGDEHRLRPVADLNARLQMSAPFLRLWRKWNGDRTIYWRLFSSRKLRLPTDYDELVGALGPDAFDARNRVGVLVTSPFRVAGRRLRRIGVLLSATDRTGVDTLDRTLRDRFER